MKIKIVLLALFGITILLFPISIYVWVFHQNQISTDLNSWGVFGDFIGGTMNPILSLANLVVLGYLTFLVAKQSNEQNRKMALHDKRMVAYDRLCENVAKINSFHHKSGLIPQSPNTDEVDINRLIDYKEKLLSELKNMAFFYIELSSSLREFNLRYSHLFDYDFKSYEFVQLVKDSESTFEYFITRFNIKEENISPPDFKLFADRLLHFINAIRNEVIEKGKGY